MEWCYVLAVFLNILCLTRSVFNLVVHIIMEATDSVYNVLRLVSSAKAKEIVLAVYQDSDICSIKHV